MGTRSLIKWRPLLRRLLGWFPVVKGMLHMSGLNQLLDSLTLRAAHGAMHKFAFRTGKHSGRQVEQLLAERGIRVYERTKLGAGELGFSVRSDQAEWAEYLLCHDGVPLTSELLNPAHGELLHPNGKGAKTLLDRIMQWLAWF